MFAPSRQKLKLVPFQRSQITASQLLQKFPRVLHITSKRRVHTYVRYIFYFWQKQVNVHTFPKRSPENSRFATSRGGRTMEVQKQKLTNRQALNNRKRFNVLLCNYKRDTRSQQWTKLNWIFCSNLNSTATCSWHSFNCVHTHTDVWTRHNVDSIIRDMSKNCRRFFNLLCLKNSLTIFFFFCNFMTKTHPSTVFELNSADWILYVKEKINTCFRHSKRTYI